MSKGQGAGCRSDMMPLVLLPSITQADVTRHTYLITFLNLERMSMKYK